MIVVGCTKPFYGSAALLSPLPDVHRESLHSMYRLLQGRQDSTPLPDAGPTNIFDYFLRGNGEGRIVFGLSRTSVRAGVTRMG